MASANNNRSSANQEDGRHRGNTPSDAAARSPKQSLPAAKSVDTQSVTKRFVSFPRLVVPNSERAAIRVDGPNDELRWRDLCVSARDNIFCWKGTIIGSKDTVFEGTEYKLSLLFPNDYPFKPPKVKFETGCFHPNVDIYGNICLDILQDKWSSAYDVKSILLSIQSLLGEPNTSSPLNTQAAQLWSNQEEYRKMVEKLYKAPSA
ncbi:hypothetical protein MLD38_025357 [Melastoma candidum]|uniref:Uncharacterized protein n=1 Tax=Melastoma candidum TaxID=119954 RepID=A0ACB9P0B1_9MYRT|nr:hypothetical protein MLD38_025357 [Melastoma candidum]